MGNSAGSFNSVLSNNQILQAVQTEFTSVWSQATVTLHQFYDVTGYSVTITPKSNKSKIVLMGHATVGCSSLSAAYFIIRINKSGSPIYTGQYMSGLSAATAPGLSQGNFGGVTNTHAQVAGCPFIAVDIPNTTSSVTYQVQAACGLGSVNLLVNGGGADTDNNSHSRGFSNIIALEIL